MTTKKKPTTKPRKVVIKPKLAVQPHSEIRLPLADDKQKDWHVSVSYTATAPKHRDPTVPLTDEEIKVLEEADAPQLLNEVKLLNMGLDSAKKRLELEVRAYKEVVKERDHQIEVLFKLFERLTNVRIGGNRE